MGEIEGDGDGGAAFRTKPFVAKVTYRLEGNPFGGKFGMELLYARLELGAVDLELEIANACAQQLFVGETRQVEV